MSNRHAPIARYRIHRSDGNGKGESIYTDDTTTAAEAAEGVGVVVEELLVDKAAIVAELERLNDEWHQRSLQDAKSDLIAPHAFSSGICSGLAVAIQVVQAGGALPPEEIEKEVDS